MLNCTGITGGCCHFQKPRLTPVLSKASTHEYRFFVFDQWNQPPKQSVSNDQCPSRRSEGIKIMPAKSKAQQKAAGAALSAKRGETKKSALKGAPKDMVESMTEKELEELASTKQKGLPEHKSE